MHPSTAYRFRVKDAVLLIFLYRRLPNRIVFRPHRFLQFFLLFQNKMPTTRGSPLGLTRCTPCLEPRWRRPSAPPPSARRESLVRSRRLRHRPDAVVRPRRDAGCCISSQRAASGATKRQASRRRTPSTRTAVVSAAGAVELSAALLVTKDGEDVPTNLRILENFG